MPLWSNTDKLTSKPKFPKERTERGIVTLSAAVQSTNSTINFTVPVGTLIANGWIANGVNLTTTGTLGFNENGPYVVNISGGSVTLSAAINGTVHVGDIIQFSRPLTQSTGNSIINIGVANNIANNYGYFPGRSANTYNANTYLVSYTRMTNANSLMASSGSGTGVRGTTKSSDIAHVGWVYAQFGTGYVKSGTIKVTGNGYANGTATIAANTTYPGGSGAVLYFWVNANGSIVNTAINSIGNSYVVTPTITLPLTTNNHSYISALAGNNQAFGTNYVNGYLTITATNGVGANANASYQTYSANGGINVQTVILISGGGGYDGNTKNLSITGANGTGATFNVSETLGANATITLVMGGKANRIWTEVLVAMNTANVLDATSGGLWVGGI